MNAKKKCINVTVTILLIIAIIITMFSGFVRFVLTDKDIYLNLLDKTGTYSTVRDEIYNKMDSILGDNATDNLKESIITEDDIKKEADGILTSLIYGLKSGQLAEPQIDTTIYRDRIAEALKSLTGYGSQLEQNSNLTSSKENYRFNVVPMNTYKINDRSIQRNDLIVKNSQSFNEGVIINNVATRAELEAQGRAMLREKGMTEDQARQKLAEKGLSEEQAWDYLRKNGYLDEEQDTVDSAENSNSNKDADSKADNKPNMQASEDSSESNSLDKSSDSLSNNKVNSIVMPIILDKNKTFDEKMNEISSKLLDYAQSIIDSEVDKVNFSKLTDSSKVKMIFKVTSTLYNMFYVCLIVTVFLIILLTVSNSFKLNVVESCIAKATFISGIITSLIFGSMYLSKFYKMINLGTNKAYFEPMFLATANYYCQILFMISIIISAIGLIMNIFVIRKRITRR